VTYFANYRPQINDLTRQNKEWHVTNQLSKFEPNPRLKSLENQFYHNRTDHPMTNKLVQRPPNASRIRKTWYRI